MCSNRLSKMPSIARRGTPNSRSCAMNPGLHEVLFIEVQSWTPLYGLPAHTSRSTALYKTACYKKTCLRNIRRPAFSARVLCQGSRIIGPKTQRSRSCQGTLAALRGMNAVRRQCRAQIQSTVRTRCLKKVARTLKTVAPKVIYLHCP